MTNRSIPSVVAVLWILGCGSVDESGGDPTSCYSRSECAAGEYCSFAYEEATAEDPEPGSCLPLRVEGEPCLDGQCEDGSVCGGDALCVAIVGEGETCGAGDVCDDGLICHQGYDPSQCQAPSAEDGPCGSVADCVEGLTCNAGFSPAQCKAASLEGGECGATDDCVTGLTCEGGACTGEMGGTDGEAEAKGCKSTQAGGSPASALGFCLVATAALALARRRSVQRATSSGPRGRSL